MFKFTFATGGEAWNAVVLGIADPTSTSTLDPVQRLTSLGQGDDPLLDPVFLALPAALEPVAATYLPATHSMQSDASSTPGPAAYRPAEHWMQSDAASEPVDSTYRPATHSMHADA